MQHHGVTLNHGVTCNSVFAKVCSLAIFETFFSCHKDGLIQLIFVCTFT